MLKKILSQLFSPLPDTPKDLSPEFSLAYYEHQYDRVDKLEGQRLTFANIILTLTAGIFTLGYSNITKLNLISGIGLPTLSIILNSFAAIYTWRTLQFIRIHRERAKAILKEYAKDIYRIDTENSSPQIGMRLGLAKLQMYFHIILIVLSIVPIVLYIGNF